MPKLEPGMLCRVVGSTVCANNGLIVTTIAKHREPPIPPSRNKAWTPWGAWWEIDTPLLTNAGRSVPYAPEHRLEPIKRDDTPAEEGFQQELKQLLCKEKQRSVSKQ